MTTTNRELLVDALAAPVSWLANQTAFTDLGLNEFWTWTGQVMPIPAEGSVFPSDMLPALVAEFSGASKSDERTSSYEIIEIDITGALIYGTQSGDNQYAAATCLRSLMVLHDSLTSSTARETLWGAPSSVGHFEFSIEGVDVVPSENHAESIDFVVGNWSLRVDALAPHAQ